MRTLARVPVVALLLLLLATAYAEEPFPVRVVATEVTPKTVAPDGTVSVRVEVEVDPGYHVYGLATPEGLPTKFKAGKDGWGTELTPGTATESPEPKAVEQVGLKSLIHEGRTSFTIPLTVGNSADVGAREISFGIEVQPCNETQCLMPQTLPVTAKFEVIPPVRIVKSEFAAKTAAAGGEAALDVEFAIAEHWHVYAQKQAERPPKFEWSLPPGWTPAGPAIEVTPPHDAKLYGLDEVFSIHEGRLVLRYVFKVPADAKPGPATLTGKGGWWDPLESTCRHASLSIL